VSEVSPRLLQLLVCPRCRGTLVPRAEASRLDCLTCQLGYPIREGIPIMLTDEADQLPG
jgi:uncharacterized protein